ncbi:hypothetical protein SEA_OCTOBIEN14_46 [Gordonia phage Octobien14]|uniref:Uncharacterized protein n=1 Tax=Gordonia phage Octobien14 TaxID=2483673 RepID=A0A3G3MAK2_9CAUD|nr:hypothetical protein L3Y22_gp046 [Gordonia phage Octobien14]AYR03279.1 hypothetical protein SEA_OCTOBIEN14_46 [Gordonia phage Octobien14]
MSLLGRVAGFYGSIRLRPAGSSLPETGWGLNHPCSTKQTNPLGAHK